MKKRLRQGAKLIVVDPRRTDSCTPACRGLVSPATVAGTNVAVMTALAHVIVTEGLVNGPSSASAASWDDSSTGAAFAAVKNSSEAAAQITGVPAETIRARRGSMPPAATPRSITASASPSTARARPR